MPLEFNALDHALSTLEDCLNMPNRGTQDLSDAMGAVSYVRQSLWDAYAGNESFLGLSNSDLAAQEIFRQPTSERTLAADPIFIIGHRRSGTTLLAWLLNSHPVLCAVPENDLCTSLCRPDTATSPFSFLKSLEQLGEPRRRCMNRFAFLIDGVFRDYASRQGKQRWVNKEVYLESRLDLLDAIFDYRARYLYIVRHGLDVAFSASAADRWINPALTRSSLAIERHLHSWAAHNHSTADFQLSNRDRCLLIRYEDLIGSPELIAQEILEFLGEQWVPTILDDMQRQKHPLNLGDQKIIKTRGKIHDESVGRWKAWPPELILRLGPVANPVLRRLGYEPVGMGRKTEREVVQPS
jgi:hypothetical protein